MTVGLNTHFVLGNTIYPQQTRGKSRDKSGKPIHPAWFPDSLKGLSLEAAAAEMVVRFFNHREKQGHVISNLGTHLSDYTWELLTDSVFDEIPSLNVPRFKSELIKRICRKERGNRAWWQLDTPSKAKLLAPHQHGINDLLARLETKYGSPCERIVILGESCDAIRDKKQSNVPIFGVPEHLKHLPYEEAAACMVVDFMDRNKGELAISGADAHLSQHTWERLQLEVFEHIPKLCIAEFEGQLAQRLVEYARQKKPWLTRWLPDPLNPFLEPYHRGMVDLVDRLEDIYRPYHINQLV